MKVVLFVFIPEQKTEPGTVGRLGLVVALLHAYPRGEGPVQL